MTDQTKLPVRDDIDPRAPLPIAPCYIEVGRMGGAPVHFLHDPERPERTLRAFEDYDEFAR